MKRVRLFRAGERPRELELAACAALGEHEANLVWVELEAPTDSELLEVARLFGLDLSDGKRSVVFRRRVRRRDAAR